MNAMLHDIDGDIMLADTLSNQGKALKDFDVVLANPPFGTKKVVNVQHVMTSLILRAINS
ncbi:N-6 DNA Methylase [Megamonas hypermegale ART12/1]|nr:N-6 DNA Methylase [Megamonas hypermegale ART12/1]